jgi:hypothetical protein
LTTLRRGIVCCGMCIQSMIKYVHAL